MSTLLWITSPSVNLSVLGLAIFQLPFIVSLIWLCRKSEVSWTTFCQSFIGLHLLNTWSMCCLVPAIVIYILNISRNEFLSGIGTLLAFCLTMLGVSGISLLGGQIALIERCSKLKFNFLFGIGLFFVNIISSGLYLLTPFGAVFRLSKID